MYHMYSPGPQTRHGTYDTRRHDSWAARNSRHVRLACQLEECLDRIRVWNIHQAATDQAAAGVHTCGMFLRIGAATLFREIFNV
jgi:hypothetical protein